jgi:hypothetical protein
MVMTKIKIIFSCLILLVLKGNSVIAQKASTLVYNGKEYKVTKSQKITKTCTYLDLCSGAGKTQTCLSVIKNGANEYFETSLSLLELQSLAANKSVKPLRGINYLDLKKKSIPYLVKGTRVVFLIGKNISVDLFEYETSGSETNGVATKLKDTGKTIQCKNNCFYAFQDCYDECTRNNARFDCYDGCDVSYIGCHGICEKWVHKNNYSLDIAIKPSRIIIK